MLTQYYKCVVHSHNNVSQGQLSTEYTHARPHKQLSTSTANKKVQNPHEACTQIK